jgi:hypothetical protein
MSSRRFKIRSAPANWMASQQSYKVRRSRFGKNLSESGATGEELVLEPGAVVGGNG